MSRLDELTKSVSKNINTEIHKRVRKAMNAAQNSSGPAGAFKQRVRSSEASVCSSDTDGGKGVNMSMKF